MVRRAWVVPPGPGEGMVQELARCLAVPPLLARCLVRRGLADPAAAERFLAPALVHLHDPAGFSQMEAACARIWRAVSRKERILILGDYDADGLTATALLLGFFDLVGVDAGWHVPDRLREGFSIGPSALARVAREGTTLAITVDNGIGAVAELAELRRLGCDVIVTDHHEPGPELPAATALLDPKAPGEGYPFSGLAGVGVAFKLAWGLARRFTGAQTVAPPFRQFLLEAMGLVALGTVADVSPLIDENRVLVSFGLEALSRAATPGLAALLATCRLEGRRLTAWDVAFRLAPRINAAGRMGDAGVALALLRTRSAEEGSRLAGELERANGDRQRVERRILAEAEEELQRHPALAEAPIVVLGRQGWHPGVVGIVAARLQERLGKAVVLVALEGECGRGSARSPEGFPIHEALARAEDLLLSHGGHPRAAGLKVETSRFAAFQERLQEVGAGMDRGAPPLVLDAEVALGELTPGLVQDLNRLGPHGTDNPPPLFAGHGLVVAGHPWATGWEGRDLAFHVREKDTVRRAVVPQGTKRHGGRVVRGMSLSLAFTPRLGSGGEVELQVQDLDAGAARAVAPRSGA